MVNIIVIKIGKLHIGYRSNDRHLWKKYLIPKAYNNKSYYKYHYFKFYYRWLNFFWCMPRKCDCCGKYMTEVGATNVYDMDRNKIYRTICKPCLDSKEYINKFSIKHKVGYLVDLMHKL